MKVLILDNYDSFTYNLVAQVQQLGLEYDVYRNDKIDVHSAAEYDKIILSPGPGLPNEAGVMKDMIGALAPTHSILGVCLGHQGIAESFGAKLELLERVFHGVATDVKVKVADYMFDGISDVTRVGRYHSWVVDPASMPDALEVTAETENETIMALRHKEYDVRGLQFHPESVLTDDGFSMVRNFLMNANG